MTPADAPMTPADAPLPQPAPAATPEAADAPTGPEREVELKLELAPADWKRLSRHAVLKEAQAGPAKNKRMEATYFDTPDQRLRAKGVSLRVRRIGKARIQTAKAADGPAAGLFDRAEYEATVAGDAPDLAQLDATPLAPLFAKRKIREGLAPAFAVSTRRRILPVARDGFAAEMAVDEGVVTAGERTEPFCEIELELTSGAPGALFRFARAIAEAVPARLGFRTKSERGYALAAGEGPQVVKKIEVALDPAMPAGAAFQAIARACLAQLVANEAALRDLRAPGAVHQSRVALRRLRAAMTLFKRVVEDDRRRAVSAELKWMANALGAARDLDVYVATVIEPLRAAHPDDADLARVAEAFAARREAAYAAALEASTGERYRLMLIDTAAWIEAGDWLVAERPLRDAPVEGFAARLLKKRAKRIRKEGAGIATLEPEARHELRIEVKKLRYAVEFFESAFTRPRADDEGAKRARKAGKRHAAILGALEALQEDLGALNDIAVGETMAARFVDPDPALARGLAKLARPDAEEAAAAHLAAARKAYKRFAAAKPFWE